ncbi:MAG: hypothetical protein II178_07270 [Selenomonadaceae bacterium]|nr:hypothetical protein [Selenomonadaceae bacterium]MBQ3971824.1 hypothetical protein [Selenomonadaceae bacterium]
MRERKEIGMMKVWFLSLLMAALLLVPAESLAAETDASAKEELESAYKSMAEVKNGNVEVEFLLNSVFMNVNGKLDMDFSAEAPKTSKGKLQMTVSNVAEPTTTEYPFYITEEEKNYILYYQDKDQWYKDVFSKEDPSKAEEKSPAYQAFAEEVKGIDETVRLGEGDAQQQTYITTIDAGKFWSSFGKYMKSTMKPGDEKYKDVQEGIFDILSSMGDVEYEVTVDKATNHVVSARTDLAQPIANLMASLENNSKIDGKLRTFATLALIDAKLTVSAKGSQYNQVSEVKIPESVVKNAKSAPKDDKKDTKEKK